MNIITAPSWIADHSVCFESPEWLATSAWEGHIPFGMWIISVLRPRVIAELGVHKGTSYCAFCQAIAKLDLDAKAYGIDTWQGDPRNNYYDRNDYWYGDTVILDALREHHDPRYSKFSTLMQMPFEAAIDIIPEEIDLLHIDGGHMYEAVKFDYETWLPKMSQRGVMLFHDVAITDRPEFGVHTLWNELMTKHSNFQFHHSSGLGVLVVGSELPTELSMLVNTPMLAEADDIRATFELLARQIGWPHW